MTHIMTDPLNTDPLNTDPRCAETAHACHAQDLSDRAGDVPDKGVTGVDLVVEGLCRLGRERNPAAVRGLITAAAATLPGAVDAALTIRVGERLITTGQTSDLPLAVDALQYRHGGPCVDAATAMAISVDARGERDKGRDFVHAEDLRVEARWPAFAQATVQQTPVLSVLAYRLTLGDLGEDVLGSLNLYAVRPHAFTPETITAGRRLAAYTAVVLARVAQRGAEDADATASGISR